MKTKTLNNSLLLLKPASFFVFNSQIAQITALSFSRLHSENLRGKSLLLWVRLR